MHYFGDFCDNVFENLEETPGDAGTSFPGGKNYDFSDDSDQKK